MAERKNIVCEHKKIAEMWVYFVLELKCIIQIICFLFLKEFIEKGNKFSTQFKEICFGLNEYLLF